MICRASDPSGRSARRAPRCSTNRTAGRSKRGAAQVAAAGAAAAAAARAGLTLLVGEVEEHDIGNYTRGAQVDWLMSQTGARDVQTPNNPYFPDAAACS